MKNSFFNTVNNFWKIDVIGYINNLQENPIRIVLLIIDLAIVLYLAYKIIYLPCTFVVLTKFTVKNPPMAYKPK